MRIRQRVPTVKVAGGRLSSVGGTAKLKSDTLSLVPAYGLEQSARAFAKIIDEVNKVEIGALRGGPMTTTR